MTPPATTPQQTETLYRADPVCEPLQPTCSLVQTLVEDLVTQSSFILERRECVEVIRRIPRLNLFEQFPELRQRLEGLNHRQGTITRPPQATPSPSPRSSRPQVPNHQPAPAPRPPRPQPGPVTPGAPSTQPTPATPPSSGRQSRTMDAGVAVQVAVAVVTGAVGGAIARGVGRALRALGR